MFDDTASKQSGKGPGASLRQFNSAVAMDMKGMAWPSDHEAAFGTLKSLVEFDDKQQYTAGQTLLNSPRSVEACLRLGVTPVELLKQKFVIPPGSDAEVAKMRFVHNERRRKQKLKAAREERLLVASEQTNGTSGASDKPATMISTMVENEEQRIQRVLAANQSQLRQQLLYDERMKKKLLDREGKVVAQRERDEQAKREKARLARKHMKEQEERAREQRKLRDMEKAEAEAAIRQRMEDIQAQEEKRLQLVEEQRQRREAQNLENRRIAALRMATIKDISSQILEERREMYEDKQSRADQSRRAFEEFREEARKHAKQKAAEKEQRIRDAQSRGQEIENQKIQLALAKQLKAEQARKRFEEERERKNDQKKHEDFQKEMRRHEAYQTAKTEEQRKIQELLDRQEATEQNKAMITAQKNRELRLRKEELGLKQLDKLENVNRMKKIYEFQKHRTLAKIEDKMQRSEYISLQRSEMKLRRQQQREEVERSKVFFTHITPGPGEYLGTETVNDRHRPNWRFGVAREDTSAGALDHGVESPGPAAYSPTPTGKFGKPKHTLVFPKANRFPDGPHSFFHEGRPTGKRTKEQLPSERAAVELATRDLVSPAFTV